MAAHGGGTVGWTARVAVAFVCAALLCLCGGSFAGAAAPVCRPPADSHVVAADAQVVVSLQTVDEFGAGAIVYRVDDCARSSGGERTVYSNYLRNADGFASHLEQLSLAGWTLGISVESIEGDPPSTSEQIDAFDLARSTRPLRGRADPCPGPHPADTARQPDTGCVLSSLRAATNGDIAWTYSYRLAPSYDPGEITCPSAQLCVSPDAFGGLMSSHDPAAGARSWRRTQLLPATTGLSTLGCASSQLCLATYDHRSTTFLATLDPEDSAQTGAAQPVPDPNSTGENDIVCPDASLCLLANGQQLEASSDPAAGAAGFGAVLSAAQLVAFDPWFVTCASTSLCLSWDNDAADQTIVASTAPAQPGSWQAAQLPGTGGPPLSLTCPSDDLCAGPDRSGQIYVSADPAAGDWSAVQLESADRVDLNQAAISLACPSPQLCVAVDAAGTVFSSTDPAGGISTWHHRQLVPAADAVKVDQALAPGITCPASDLCLIWLPTTELGRTTTVFSTTHPATGAWRRVIVHSPTIEPLTCPTTTECVGINRADGLVSSDDPTGPAAAWHEGRWDAPDCAIRGTTCAVDQIWLLAGRHPQRVAQTDPGRAGQIRRMAFNPASTQLTWFQDGHKRLLSLG